MCGSEKAILVLSGMAVFYFTSILFVLGFVGGMFHLWEIELSQCRAGRPNLRKVNAGRDARPAEEGIASW